MTSDLASTTEAPTETAPFAPDELDAIRDDVGYTDVGTFATTDDERTLHRYVKRLTSLADERTRLVEQTASMLASIDSKAKGIEYVYAGLVQDITRRLLAAQHGKAKSIKTPFGTVGFRRQAAKLVVIDELQVIAEAGGNVAMAGVVETVTEVRLSKSKLNEYFVVTGEIPPGTEVVPERENFFCK